MIRCPHVLRAAIAHAHVEELVAEGRRCEDPGRLAAIAAEVELAVGSIGRIREEAIARG